MQEVSCQELDLSYDHGLGGAAAVYLLAYDQRQQSNLDIRVANSRGGLRPLESPSWSFLHVIDSV